MAAVAAPSPFAFRPVEGVKPEEFFDTLVQKGRTAYERAIGELNQVAERIKGHTQRWDQRNLTLVAGTVTDGQQAELKRDVATYTLEREKREQAKKLIRELEEIISQCEPVEETPEVVAYKLQLAKLKIELSGVEAAHNALFVTARNDLIAKKGAVEKVLGEIEAVWKPFAASAEAFAMHCKSFTGFFRVTHLARMASSGSMTPLLYALAQEQAGVNAELPE